ncbi:cupin domain-containing protein [Portibacter marinus]|uniref:cupin domain-containing protein n=1 Tax=Portibacter marinus TaxID=2898660 RepID=UPI001F1C8B7C|nr:cupin domain-containing protein [Portibacter marinus]
MNHITVNQALQKLSTTKNPFVEIFTHGTLAVEIYKPHLVDLQEPHTRDEVYIIAQGKGEFQHNDQATHVNKGDFLFVPAGDKHRFFNLSDDFSTWVLFYGPEGGE